MIVIQNIIVEYQKIFRDAYSASARNKIPHAFVLPKIDEEAFLFEHRITQGRYHTTFSDTMPYPMRGKKGLKRREFESLKFEELEDRLSVRFQYNSSPHRTPNRGERPLYLFNLKKGQTGCFKVNSRIASIRAQSYIQQYVNFGYHISELDSFTNKPFDFEVDKRVCFA